MPAFVVSSDRALVVPAPVSPATTPVAEDLGARLGRVYGLAQHSAFLFASPLGPFTSAGRSLPVPRFVYFGPQTTNDSLRLAFYAGFSSAAPGPALALAHWIERLALAPEFGQGLNLSFFPLVDVIGATLGGDERQRAPSSWLDPDPVATPELALLAQDVRLRGYHGFVCLRETDTDVLGVSLRGPGQGQLDASGVELVSSEEGGPFEVRFEADPLTAAVADGPLTLAADLPFAPFELTLRLPRGWPVELQREAAATFLKRFILRYRAHQSFADHI